MLHVFEIKLLFIELDTGKLYFEMHKLFPSFPIHFGELKEMCEVYSALSFDKRYEFVNMEIIEMVEIKEKCQVLPEKN